MDGVNDDRDAGARGGESSKNAGFAAVGVDEVGALEAKKPGELAEGQGVLPGMDGPDESGDKGKEIGRGVQRRF